MSLDLVLGPMWAGKSSYILATIRRHKSIGWDVLVVVNPLDNRYGTHVVSSHDHDQVPALALSELDTLFEDERYQKAKLLIIEEAQFFKNLYNFVCTAVDRDGKHVVCVGLDGDAERRPFGEVLSLVPICDNVKKIKSLCSECKDGTPALFSYRVASIQEQVAVGADDLYKPLCRKHYLEKKKE